MGRFTAPDSRAAGYLALVGAGALWGLGFVFGKIALAHMPVSAMIAYRFAIGAAAIAPVLFRRRIRIQRADVWYFALAALLYVPVQFSIAFEGLRRTSVTHASLMCALVPVFVGIASRLFGGRGSRPNWTAIVASVTGAALIVFGKSSGASAAGDALVVLSLIAAVAWIMISERRLQAYDPVAAAAVILIAGSGMLLAFELVAHPAELFSAYPAAAWLATAASGLLSTAAATSLWMIGLSRVPAADAGIFINLEPIVGSACGVAFLGDPLRWTLVAGAVLVIGSAVAVTRSKPAIERPSGISADRPTHYDSPAAVFSSESAGVASAAR